MMGRVFASFIVALAIGGCATTERIVNLENRPIGLNARQGDTGSIIETALGRRGWIVTARRDGEIDATLDVRRGWAPPGAADEFRADIIVAYDADTYSIRYRDSEGLSHRNGRIHRNYNGWIARLDHEISAMLHREPH